MGTLERQGYTVLVDAFPPDLRDELIAEADCYVFTPPHPRVGGAFAMVSLDRGTSASPPRSTCPPAISTSSGANEPDGGEER